MKCPRSITKHPRLHMLSFIVYLSFYKGLNWFTCIIEFSAYPGGKPKVTTYANWGKICITWVALLVWEIMWWHQLGYFISVFICFHSSGAVASPPTGSLPPQLSSTPAPVNIRGKLLHYHLCIIFPILINFQICFFFFGVWMASLCLVRHKTNIRSLWLELEGMLAKVSTDSRTLQTIYRDL